MKRGILAVLLSLFLVLPGVDSGAAESLTLETEVHGAILMDANGQQTLFDLYADAPFEVAGLTKLPAILTLAQAFDEGLLQPTAEMLVSTRAAEIPGPTAFLEAGETIAASELLKAAVMISAGDAVMTLGENAFGSESVFVENINATLRLAGVERQMTDALGNDMQFSARELGLLGCAALESETYIKYCALYRDEILHADGRETELVNANRLVRTYTGCKGLITGSSGTSTYCGVFGAERTDTGFTAVVIGAANSEARFAAAETLLNYGFANFVGKRICKAGEVLAEAVPVKEGTIKSVNLVSRETVRLLLDKTAPQPTEVRDVPELLTAPVNAEEPLGSIVYEDAAGGVLATVPLYAETGVAAFGWREVFHAILRSYMGR